MVCGLHDVGLRVAEQLHTAGVGVLVVDEAPDERRARDLAALGVPLLALDGRVAGTLEQAGVADAQALVCVEEDDLHNLAIALLVREVNPGLRIVVQMGNAAVGRALADAGVQVLDVAAVAAPDIVEACLRSGLHRVRVGDEELVVAEASCTRSGTLRALYGDLAPLAVIPSGGSHVELAPGRDRSVRPGDTAVMVGTRADLAPHGLGRAKRAAEPEFVGSRGYRQPGKRPVAVVSYVVRNLDVRLKRVLVALALLVALSTGVLMLGYSGDGGRRMSLVDALYFTVETIGTVGYGDFYFRDQDTWLRVWAIGLMVVGATMATVFFALLTNVLISRTLEQTLGRRKVTGLSDHVIVVGLGSVGVAVVDRLLAAGVDVVVVESDESNRFLARMREYDVPVVVADATLPETLTMVRLEHAAAVAVVTSSDLANIETGLAVRDLLGDSWADVPVVLRLFDRALARTVETSFDFQFVRSTANLAAPWFVGAALGLDVLSTFYVGDLALLVARLIVPADSGLDGLAMRELSVRTRVVSLTRADGSPVHNPRGDTRLGGGDVAYLVGPYDELLQLLSADARSRA